LSNIPIASFSFLWATIYDEIYSALSKSGKLDTEDVAYWLNYARGYVDPSQCIVFKQLTPFCPPQFFDDEFVSPILHLLYFFSKFLSAPTKRPPISPGRHLFAIGAPIQQSTEHKTTLDTGFLHWFVEGPPLRHALNAQVPHGFYTPFAPGSTVSSNNTRTTQWQDAVNDSVQSSLDRLQSQLDQKIDTLAQTLESNLQIGLNKRFGMMSARLAKFQSHTDQKLEERFTNFWADLLEVRTTFREKLNSFRARSNFSSCPIPSTNFQSYRSTSDRPHTGEFKDINSHFSDNFLLHHSRPSSPISVLLHESVSSRSPSIRTVLMANAPPMDSSSRVALDLSLKQFEPKGIIMDVESCQQFLRDFHRYKDLGGSKNLSTLLQVPLDPKVSFISNFSSPLYGFNPDFLLDDTYAENQLLQLFPSTLSAYNAASRLSQLKMTDTNKTDPTALITFFAPVLRYLQLSWFRI